jgi:hypothetical protein
VADLRRWVRNPTAAALFREGGGAAGEGIGPVNRQWSIRSAGWDKPTVAAALFS